MSLHFQSFIDTNLKYGKYDIASEKINNIIFAI